MILRKLLSCSCSYCVPCVVIRYSRTSFWASLGRSMFFIAVLAMSTCD